MPLDVGVAGGQLVNAQRPGVAGADRWVVVQPDLRSGVRACPGPKCRHMFHEPRRASVLVHHQVSRVLQLVLQRVQCHVWVVRHPCSYQQGGATGDSTKCGLACPHLHYYPLGPELRLSRRLGALVVRGHQPQRRRRVGPGAQGLRPCHIRVRLLVLAFREYPVEDVHQGRRQVVRRPPAWGGRGRPGGGRPRRGGAGRPGSSVGRCGRPAVLPGGVDESQAGVTRAGGVEEVDQGVAPPGVVGGLLLAAAIVEVFIGALIEALPHRRRPRVVVVGEAVSGPVVPMPRRCVRHRQAARVAVSQLGGAQRDDVAWRGL